MEKDKFNFLTEQFDDIKILRYQVPAFGQLPLREKIFVYYLSQAALAGRDILWDQNNRYNLRIRKILEWIVREYPGDRNTDEFERFLIYTKKVFFANGIHHHYSMDKFIPGFSKTYFQELLASVGIPEVFPELERIMFDSGYMAKRVVLDEGKDLIRASANNYYVNVTQREVEEFYRTSGEEDSCPVSRGLNSTLVKEDGVIREAVWKIGGKYGQELARVVAWLEKAIPYVFGMPLHRPDEPFIRQAYSLRQSILRDGHSRQPRRKRSHLTVKNKTEKSCATSLSVVLIIPQRAADCKSLHRRVAALEALIRRQGRIFVVQLPQQYGTAHHADEHIAVIHHRHKVLFNGCL